MLDKKLLNNNDLPPRNPPQPGEVTPVGKIVCTKTAILVVDKII